MAYVLQSRDQPDQQHFKSLYTDQTHTHMQTSTLPRYPSSSSIYHLHTRVMLPIRGHLSHRPWYRIRDAVVSHLFSPLGGTLLFKMQHRVTKPPPPLSHSVLSYRQREIMTNGLVFMAVFSSYLSVCSSSSGEKKVKRLKLSIFGDDSTRHSVLRFDLL